MKIPAFNICRIELRKMVKRKDFLSLFGILGIGILFSASIMADGYEGAKGQSALYWMVTQMLNSSILLIAPMILAYNGVRTMAQEIENGSLKLFDRIVRDRKKIYAAKSAALLIYSTLFFAACVLIQFAIYYGLVCRNERFADGAFAGNNTSILLCVLFTLYLSTFVLVPQAVLFLGTFAKQGICIGGVFLLVLAAHNIYKMPVVGYLSPWRSIIRLADDVLNTTDKVAMAPAFMVSNVLSQALLCGAVSAACVLCGMHILQNRDL